MLLDYEQPLYRPPSEASNLILQITIGCRFNQCSFCAMYKHKEYRLKSLDEIQHDINKARQFAPATTRIFLADGDAFNLSSDQLLSILELLQAAFPALTRVSCYATPANISAKTSAQLSLLRDNKLSLIYLGIESGSDTLLKKISKGASKNSIIRSLKMADAARIKVSATIILGLGGQQYSREHIAETISLLNLAPVTYLSTLQLFLDESSRTEFLNKFSGTFIEQSDAGILHELSALVSQLEPPKRIIFRTNHASNALALAGNLPKDKTRLTTEISQALDSPRLLTARSLRSL
ncbi:MAG: radical SAM protein [Gammaproteobacteria bacterium]|nr:radical SAM protein [Gammaproteobacteria bacterium]